MLKAESAFEKAVGIECHTTPGHGVSGIHKQRYSDFIVREIRKGKVCSLISQSTQMEQELFSVPVEQDAAPTGSINLDALFTDIELAYTSNEATSPFAEDSAGKESLRAYLQQVEGLFPDTPAGFSTVLVASQKPIRTALHGAFRKHTGKLVETSTEGAGDESRIKVNFVRPRAGAGGGGGANPQAGVPRRAVSKTWPANLPKYLQFTLLKENIDTMNAVQHICKTLHIREKDAVQYAGTKDKRGVTAQQCTVYCKKPSEVIRVGHASLYGAKICVGDFAFVEQPVRLGENDGNQFTITLRQIKQSKEVTLAACEAVKKTGFINYYGLQRFGKGARKTHELGRAVFKNDFKAVCDYIFEESELDLRARNYDGSDVIAAKLCYREGDYAQALQLLPKSMNTERAIVEVLKQKPGDFSGALHRVPKFQRLMYVHAYQSYLWNVAASKRVQLHGLQAVEGDLVLSKESAVDATGAPDLDSMPPEDGAADCERAAAAGQVEDDSLFKSGDLSASATVHVVTAADIAAGTYAVADVVMPIYGNKVSFPCFNNGGSSSGGCNNGVAFYDALMARDGLKPADITNHPNQAYRMGGAYRHLIQVPVDMSYEILEYTDPNAELTETELIAIKAKQSARRVAEKAQTDEVQAAAEQEPHVSPTLHALRMCFSLGPGSYATMLLREITKESTENMYQAQLTAAAAAEAKTDAAAEGEAEYPEKRRRRGSVGGEAASAPTSAAAV